VNDTRKNVTDMPRV